MAKKPVVESDEVRLKKKIAAKRTEQGNATGNTSLRALRKRLKREQRRRRSLALRKKHSSGGKDTTVTPVST